MRKRDIVPQSNGPPRTVWGKVVRTTDVKVRINTDTYDEEKVAEFRQPLSKFTTHKDHARHLA